jgi:hypothetical protein
MRCGILELLPSFSKISKLATAPYFLDEKKYGSPSFAPGCNDVLEKVYSIIEKKIFSKK